MNEEYDRLIEHLHVSAVKAESPKVTNRRLFPETLELIHQRGIERAAGNRQLTSELAKQCRQAIKKDLKERRAAVLVEAAEAGKSIRKVHRSFANYKPMMISPQRPDGTMTSSRKATEKIIHEFYLDLFDSHVHLPSFKIKEDGYVVPPFLPCEIRHASGLGSFQEHRGCSEENKENPTPCSSFRLNGSSCPNVCVRNLVAT
uniref:DNTTIP1_dimer domain-containing protein n=1 Tax=Angiostrongylus cantonensis TaxID=6313 RepID=A0A0K0DPY3_ANGCA